MAIDGYVDYQRRKFCKDIACPVQLLLEKQPPDSPEHAEVRGICQANCIHTTYEFHHWLIENGVLVVRPD